MSAHRSARPAHPVPALFAAPLVAYAAPGRHGTQLAALGIVRACGGPTR